MKDLQLALVGLGHVATRQIAAIEQTDGLHLAAACDIDADAAKRLGDSVRFYTSIDELLTNDPCDIVMISAPNREHYRLARQVIDSGKGLVLEKPAVETQDQLKDLMSAIEAGNSLACFALHAAFGAEVLWLCGELDGNELNLGPLRGFESSFYDPYVIDGALVAGAASLGGSWMDSGVNALSVLGLFLDPGELRVASSRMREPGSLECSETEAVVELETDAARGTIHTSWLTGRNHKSTLLHFENDSVLLDHSDQKAYRGTGTSRQPVFVYEGPLHRLTNHYVGVFADLVGRVATNTSNAGYAIPLHDIFFAVDEVRTWGLTEDFRSAG